MTSAGSETHNTTKSCAAWTSIFCLVCFSGPNEKPRESRLKAKTLSAKAKMGDAYTCKSRLVGLLLAPKHGDAAHDEYP